MPTTVYQCEGCGEEYQTLDECVEHEMECDAALELADNPDDAMESES